VAESDAMNRIATPAHKAKLINVKDTAVETDVLNQIAIQVP
jgi:hypothetical protein